MNQNQVDLEREVMEQISFNLWVAFMRKLVGELVAPFRRSPRISDSLIELEVRSRSGFRAYIPRFLDPNPSPFPMVPNWGLDEHFDQVGPAAQDAFRQRFYGMGSELSHEDRAERLRQVMELTPHIIRPKGES